MLSEVVSNVAIGIIDVQVTYNNQSATTDW